jgi:hypothetical protein
VSESRGEEKPEAKVRINELNRHLFPDLAKGLEKHGQLEPVQRTKDGITVDGTKREMLLGREQVDFIEVPEGSASSNIHRLNRIQRKAIVKYKYRQLIEKLGSMEAKERIARQYGISIRTIERDLDPDFATNVVTLKKKVENYYKNTVSWNPFQGCGFNCVYCEQSFQRQAKRKFRKCLKCHRFEPHAHSEMLNKVPNDRAIAVCGNSDIAFCNPKYMSRIIDVMKQDEKSGRIWFVQSKYPSYLKHYLRDFPKNTVLSTTLETNRDEGYDKVSKAPPPSVRYQMFRNLPYPRKIVAVEPIMEFDFDVFLDWILNIKPEAVYVGYETSRYEMPFSEPHMEKVLGFIVALKNKDVRVLTKHLIPMTYSDFRYVKYRERR